MTTSTMIAATEIKGLIELLEQELLSYEQLKTLGSRQSDLMKIRDLEGLAENTCLWEENLAQIQRVRDQQHQLIRNLLGEVRDDAEPDLDRLMEQCDDGTRHQVEELRKRRCTAAQDLTRQSELNQRLARFCLDLLGDEIMVFKRGLQESAGGCYDDRGERQDHGTGGVVVHQA